MKRLLARILLPIITLLTFSMVSTAVLATEATAFTATRHSYTFPNGCHIYWWQWESPGVPPLNNFNAREQDQGTSCYSFRIVIYYIDSNGYSQTWSWGWFGTGGQYQYYIQTAAITSNWASCVDFNATGVYDHTPWGFRNCTWG